MYVWWAGIPPDIYPEVLGPGSEYEKGQSRSGEPQTGSARQRADTEPRHPGPGDSVSSVQFFLRFTAEGNWAQTRSRVGGQGGQSWVENCPEFSGRPHSVLANPVPCPHGEVPPRKPSVSANLLKSLLETCRTQPVPPAFAVTDLYKHAIDFGGSQMTSGSERRGVG